MLNHAKDKTSDLARTTGQVNDKSSFFLALNFVELIIQDRPWLLECMKQMESRSLSMLLFLKFKFLGKSYQTQFVSLDENSYA